MEVPVLVTNWSVLDFKKRGKRIIHGACIFSVFDITNKCNDYYVMPFDNGLPKTCNVGWQSFRELCQPWDISSKERTDNLIAVIGEVYPMVVLRLAKNSHYDLERAFPPFYKNGVKAHLISGPILSHFSYDDELEPVSPRPLTLTGIYMSLSQTFGTLDILTHCLSQKQNTHQGVISLLQGEKVCGKTCLLDTIAGGAWLEKYKGEIEKHVQKLTGQCSPQNEITKALQAIGILTETTLKPFNRELFSLYLERVDSTSEYFLACTSLLRSDITLPTLKLCDQYDCINFPNESNFVQTGTMAYYIFISEMIGGNLMVFDAERSLIINCPLQCYAAATVPFVVDAFCGFPVYTCKINWFIKGCDLLLEKRMEPRVSITDYTPKTSHTVQRLKEGDNNLVTYLKGSGLYSGNLRKLDCANFVGTIMANIDPGDLYLKRLIRYRNMCNDSMHKGLIKQGIVYTYGSSANSHSEKYELVNRRGRQIMIQMISFIENEFGAMCFHIMKDGIIFDDPHVTNMSKIQSFIDEKDMIIRDEGTFAHAIMLSINSYILIQKDGTVKTTGINNKTDAKFVSKCLEAGIDCIKLIPMKGLDSQKCLDILCANLLGIVEQADVPHDYSLLGPPPYSYVSSCRDYLDSGLIAHRPNDLKYVKVKTDCFDSRGIESWCYNGALSGCLMNHIEKIRMTDGLSMILEKDMAGNYVLIQSLMEPVVIDIAFYLNRPLKVLKKILLLLAVDEADIDVSFSALLSHVDKCCTEKVLQIHGIQSLSSQKPDTIEEARLLLYKRISNSNV